ncbi:PTTG1 interacting protein b [Chanos chanos]|uniref:PTTG1 interacting protein b n=1 Tax=Chanos chanos TaxID=29144 RepID=A0A6J2WFE0_CHACN|nr:pituitary tumor-transforming gene 1 protein-interacting protein-like [Chanos chanos]
MRKAGEILFCVVVLALLSWTVVFAQTTPSPGTSCALKSNTSCDECLQNVSCLWCIATQQCVDYPVRSVLPSHTLCPLAEARWGLCWVNFQALIITMSVLAGVIIIAILVCCCSCCKCGNAGSRKSDERLEQQANLRKLRQEERKAEMKSRHDEIRKKYGLMKDNPYSRFENN